MYLRTAQVATTGEAASALPSPPPLEVDAGPTTPTTAHTGTPVVMRSIVFRHDPTRTTPIVPATVEGETHAVRRARPHGPLHVPPRLLLRRCVTLWTKSVSQAVQTRTPIL